MPSGCSTPRPRGSPRRGLEAVALPLLAGLLLGTPLDAQQPPEAEAADTVRAGRASDFLIPVGSLFLPGLGQFLHRAPAAGFAHAGVALTGAALADLSESPQPLAVYLPREPREQLAHQGVALAFTAGALSAWDAFHRAVPAMQRQGRYGFLPRREHVRDLLGAPFDHRFLARWTTWVDLAQTAAVTALILSDRDPGASYHPFRAHDAAFAASFSMHAAVGEEALFRGWVLPLLHERTGEWFWVANGVQAGLFGAAHLPDANWYAAVIGAWAAWEGWIVRRNQWSVRESVFHHFWYDVAVVTASMLRDDTGRERSVTLVTIRF
jgi:membrane protease YdiL (CAAX protease family)